MLTYFSRRCSLSAGKMTTAPVKPVTFSCGFLRAAWGRSRRSSVREVQSRPTGAFTDPTGEDYVRVRLKAKRIEKCIQPLTCPTKGVGNVRPHSRLSCKHWLRSRNNNGERTEDLSRDSSPDLLR